MVIDMRFDSAGIFGLRYPSGDESLVEICRVVALKDSSFQVNALISELKAGRDIVIDGLSPDDNVVAHFRKYRPDVLILNNDMLDEFYITELTIKLRDSIPKMPTLVTVGSSRPLDLERMLVGYNGRMHINIPMHPIKAAYRLREFILHEVVGYEYYRDKLKQAAELTLVTLGAQPNSPAIDYLDEAVLTVLENPYVYIGDIDMIYRDISRHLGMSIARLKRVCRPELSRMLEEMSDYTYDLAFREYATRDIAPTETELVYAAARLTSMACERLLSLMRSMPMTTPRPRIKIYCV